jgi:uncharacterized membrane protein
MEHGEVVLDTMLVVVFDNQQKAFEGRTALQQLENDGKIGIYVSAVIAKNTNGVTMLKTDGPRWAGPLVGAFLGSIIGLLGGPPGAAIGAVAGVAAGNMADLGNLRISREFTQDVGKQLTSGKFALLAEVREGWTSPVDECMGKIGGTVFRQSVWDAADTADDEELDTMKTAIRQMKIEHSDARAERKAEIEKKIKELQLRIRERLYEAQKRRAAFREEVRKLAAEQ